MRLVARYAKSGDTDTPGDDLASWRFLPVAMAPFLASGFAACSAQTPNIFAEPERRKLYQDDQYGYGQYAQPQGAYVQYGYASPSASPPAPPAYYVATAYSGPAQGYRGP